jgi:hypothetical protein
MGDAAAEGSVESSKSATTWQKNILYGIWVMQQL